MFTHTEAAELAISFSRRGLGRERWTLYQSERPASECEKRARRRVALSDFRSSLDAPTMGVVALVFALVPRGSFRIAERRLLAIAMRLQRNESSAPLARVAEFRARSLAGTPLITRKRGRLVDEILPPKPDMRDSSPRSVSPPAPRPRISAGHCPSRGTSSQCIPNANAKRRPTQVDTRRHLTLVNPIDAKKIGIDSGLRCSFQPDAVR